MSRMKKVEREELAERRGAAQERKLIVEYLRQEASSGSWAHSVNLTWAANQIERGAHERPLHEETA